MIDILSLIIGIVICVIVNLCLKPWITSYSKKWGEISAQLATKEDLKEITHSIESAKKNAEIDTQLVRKEDLKEITEAIESVKLDLEQKNIEYQLRYSKIYEKSMFELSNIMCEFISLSEKFLQHYNVMRQDTLLAFSEYDRFYDALVSVKSKIKSSMIWMPNEVGRCIDDELSFIHKKYEEVWKQALEYINQGKKAEANSLILANMSNLLKVISSSEKKVVSFINFSKFYSVDQFLK